MPLRDGYGVVIGMLDRYYPDPPEDYGEYFHANVEVLTPHGIYRCKIDVDGRAGAGVVWRTVELGETDLNGVARLPDGWHNLDSTRHSGALDYLRSPILNPELSPSYVVVDPTIELVRRTLRSLKGPSWNRGTTAQALADLALLLENQTRIFVFGEPFTHGHGVHNVHQHQGDPPGTKWSAENGIWQDGVLVVRRTSGSFAAYLTKHPTQANRTDKHGRPV
jgi:Uncharacterized conserved protein (DUF2278)